MESAGKGPALEEMMTQFEDCTGFCFPNGYDQTLGDMFHLRQPLKLGYRCGKGTLRLNFWLYWFDLGSLWRRKLCLPPVQQIFPFLRKFLVVQRTAGHQTLARVE